MEMMDGFISRDLAVEVVHLELISLRETGVCAKENNAMPNSQNICVFKKMIEFSHDLLHKDHKRWVLSIPCFIVP
jgi:hypothetical protein